MFYELSRSTLVRAQPETLEWLSSMGVAVGVV